MSAQTDLEDTMGLLVKLIDDEKIEFDSDLILDDLLLDSVPEMGRKIRQETLDEVLEQVYELDPNNATGIRKFLLDLGAIST